MLFGVVPAGAMFQDKIDEFFSGMPNAFGIADDILVAGFDALGRDYNVTLDKVHRICRQANLKHDKDKCLFKCTISPFFDEVIFWKGVSPDHRKVKALTDTLPTKSIKELQL